MMRITHDFSAHRFTTELDGSKAILDYTLSSRIMTITHTEVPPLIGGRGVAAELMRAALEAAGAAGWTVIPACSYAASYLRKHAADGDSDPPSIGGID